MSSVQIREVLHEYIDTADEKKLEAIYTVLKDSIGEPHQYSVEESAEIYERRRQYQNNEASILTTEEFVRFVLKNKL